MQEHISPLSSATQKHAEVLYLPSGVALRLISFGFAPALSHLLWFRTISYFGKHYRADRDYTWLNHMCELVIRLNPSLKHVYQFCGTMLAWEANLPDQGVAMFSQAIEQFPSDWFFYYLRGFSSIFFLHDDEAGRNDFIKSASLPGAHPVVVRLASKKVLSAQSPEAAIEFLQNILQQTQDQNSSAVLEDRLREAYFELGFRQLETAVDKYYTTYKRLPQTLDELSAAGLAPPDLKRLGFADPFGGRYFFDPASSQVKSTSRRKRDTLHWKQSQKE